jgi:mono/diheme cytochrome c family protein
MSSRAVIGLTLAATLFAAGSTAGQPAGGSFASVARFMLRDGEALYKDICAACHMPNGEGARGAAEYPALARNGKLQAQGYPVFLVMNGRNAMPSLGRFLDDAQIAAVVNYVRTHFGNGYRDSVSAADVKAVRPANLSEPSPEPDTDF